MKTTNTTPASQTTAKKSQLIRIKDEIKFVYRKMEKVNQEQFQTAQEWVSTWYIVQNSIQEAISREIGKIYKSMDNKINKLTQS